MQYLGFYRAQEGDSSGRPGTPASTQLHNAKRAMAMSQHGLVHAHMFTLGPMFPSLKLHGGP